MGDYGNDNDRRVIQALPVGFTATDCLFDACASAYIKYTQDIEDAVFAPSDGNDTWPRALRR